MENEEEVEGSGKSARKTFDKIYRPLIAVCAVLELFMLSSIRSILFRQELATNAAEVATARVEKELAEILVSNPPKKLEREFIPPPPANNDVALTAEKPEQPKKAQVKIPKETRQELEAKIRAELEKEFAERASQDDEEAE